MKQLFTKISTFLLAFFVLFSTFSFTVETHYCGDLLVGVSFVGEAESSTMSADLAACVKRDNCCKVEIQKVVGQNQLRFHQIEKLSISKQQFIALFLFLRMIYLQKINQKISFTKIFLRLIFV
ncbi:hypothetical protein BST83_19400 [Polaribacter filamentus]|uniref:Transmembrane protein n=1 Tax=Polaribacter filamentus TaxID=53483 RepID=A0A2S7KK30_9FLAO|nr:hypothetical protein [Polaribacter filamentus]PQB02974.1 hypothetical protein BST83_19390 [Polaribacter filamentus]PQB02975.1 hypothetical protein BST83_19400 [Polaribacter filamentus]